MELFAAIRRDARVEGSSIRELADKHHVHRRTMRQALASAMPPPRKTAARTSPRLELFKPAIDDMLRTDLDAPKKQRHTARRVLARLVDEHGAVDLSYSTVRDYVAKRRPEIAAEAGRPLEAGCVPQTHPPAAEAVVDFHDLWVNLRGIKTKTALFAMRLSFSGRAAHRGSLSQGQEAFLESHVYAFERLGGVPRDKIRYDNLKPVVSRVLCGRTRQETERWVAFRSHYGFGPFYCVPGHEGSHEKGGVEGEGGRFRRNHCVPMPVVESIEELNELLEAWDEADDARRNRTMGVGTDGAFERELLRPLPGERFDTTLTLTPRVDRYAQVMVRCNQYSVPARFIGHRLRVKLSASAVTVFDRTTVVARHQRAIGKGVKVLDLDPLPGDPVRHRRGGDPRVAGGGGVGRIRRRCRPRCHRGGAGRRRRSDGRGPTPPWWAAPFPAWWIERRWRPATRVTVATGIHVRCPPAPTSARGYEAAPRLVVSSRGVTELDVREQELDADVHAPWVKTGGTEGGEHQQRLVPVIVTRHRRHGVALGRGLALRDPGIELRRLPFRLALQPGPHRHRGIRVEQHGLLDVDRGHPSGPFPVPNGVRRACRADGQEQRRKRSCRYRAGTGHVCTPSTL